MRKKGKLYTVNKFNMPAFVDRVHQNVFDEGGSISNPLSFKEAFGSKGLKAGLKAGASAAISAGAGLVGGLAGNAIGGGYDDGGVGSTIGSIGSTVGTAVGAANPILGTAVSVGSQLLGGLTSRAFGVKENTALKKAVESGISQNQNFVSNAGSFDDIQGPKAAVTNTNVYEGGWLGGGSEARRKNQELKERMIAARDWANRSVGNNIDNLIDDQMNDALANYSAFGGPLQTSDNMDGAIGYGFMSDLLTTKRKNAENRNQMTNMFIEMPSSMFALGGDVQMHGGDFSTGLVSVDAGGTHEQNPNDGVQMGVDPEGVPNLVEEGETVYDDYVFSNRILADETTKRMFHLPKKKDITFADISKRLEKEISERPNDPISKAGFKTQMQTLEEQQERQKQQMEAEKAKAAFEAMTPEEQTAVMQQVAQQDAIAQQQAMQQPSPEEVQMMQQEQPMGQPEVMQQQPMMAEGGHLFDKGGKKNAGSWKKGTSAENWSAYTRNGLRDYLLKINDDLADAETEEERKKIREDAIKTVNGIQKAYSEAYQENLSPSERNEKVEALQKAFQKAGGNAYFGNIANNINLPKGHNTEDTEEKGWVDGLWGPRTSIRNWGSTEYGDAESYKDLVDLAAEAGLTYAPGEYKYGDNTLYQLGLAPSQSGSPEDELQPNPYTEGWEERRGISTSPVATPKAKTAESNIEPVKEADWMRYAGLFGPAVGLGMQMAGIGKPDYGELDTAVEGAGRTHLATYKPLGNYLTYRPMDIWFEQNRMDANARATDRAIINNAAPIGTKMAGLLASSYNSQIADGELYRKALEYNDEKRKQVAEFNRGTDQFNAEAFNRLSQFNASALNDAESRSTNARLHAAQQKLAGDAGWYNSLYGNVSGLFKGISDLGRENRETNWRNALATSGAFGVMDEDALVRAGVAKYKKGKKSAKGGKIKRGLTY